MSAPIITYPIVRPFGNKLLGPTDPGGIVLPIPLTSQVGIVPGGSSFEDGYPAATMVDPETMGGVPAYGQEFNGLDYMITQYCALLQAGLRCVYNSDAVTFFAGYSIGAQLQSVSSPGVVWTNLVDGNANDPDSVQTGWYSSVPLYAAIAPTAGQHDNFVLPGASDYALDIDTTAGPVDISGIVAGRDGQTLYLSCAGVNLLQILASNTGSTAANRIRAATDLGVIQNQTFTMKYFAPLSRWLAI